MTARLSTRNRVLVCGAVLAIVTGLAVQTSPARAASGDITTVAGTGNFGVNTQSGNGGPALLANMVSPNGVASTSGGYFESEFGLFDVRTSVVRVVRNGVINAYAGGSFPPINDGASATQAVIQPTSVVHDTAGDLYIVDSGHNRVRKVNAATGVITTVAGASVCDSTGNCTSGYSGDNGPATQAMLNFPQGLAIDSAGNLYISTIGDSDPVNGGGYGYVRKVDASTGIITTVASGGNPADGVGDNGPATSAKLFSPDALAVDGAGNLFIDDSNQQRIRRVDAVTGIITTVAGDGTNGFGGDTGPATSAELSYPTDVSVDGAGDVFIADSFNCRIRKVDTSGIISTVAGNGNYPCSGSGGDSGPATSASLYYPGSVHVDAAGELFIADSAAYRIRKVDTHGVITTVAGNGILGFSGDGGPATAAEIGVGHLDVDGAGNLLFSDGSGRIRMVDANGIITTVAGGGVGDGLPATSAALNWPEGLATDGAGNLYIADCQDNRVRKVDSAGVITSVAGTAAAHGLGDGGPATAARLWCPAAVAYSGGALYIADSMDNRVRRVDASGTISTVAGTGTSGFSGDGGPAAAAQLSAPSGVAVDGAGNLYISDKNNNRVRKVDTHGTITTFAGNGNSGGGVDGVRATQTSVTWPAGLTLGPNGVLTIAESGFARVRDVNPQGIISTVAGNGIPGYSGDGGAGPLGTLDGPTGVAYDSAGNLLVTDTNNGVIRSVAAGTPPPPPPVTKKTANCGMTVTKNLSLASDIGPCPGDGIVVGADGVHIDLNGHTISGNFGHSGNNVGIRATGRQKVKISNGTVTGFDAGVALISGSGNTVSGLTVANNQGNQDTFASIFGDGIVMFFSSGNTVSGNKVLNDGPFDGIAMLGQGADNNLVQNNLVKDTTNFDLPFYPGVGLGIVTNPFLGFDRPRMVSLNKNQIVGNTVIGNGSAGISTISNVGGVVRSNLVERNGFQSPFGGAFPGNGIGVTNAHMATPNTNELVEFNQVIGNGRDGIEVVSQGNTILDNIGNGNGAGAFGGFDFRDFNHDPVTYQPTCATNTWSGNVWGSGGFYPACSSNGGHQMTGTTRLPAPMQPPIPQGLGDPPPRLLP